MNDVYHIRTEVFDGPLDLLLSLIEKRKLLINDISLSEVTDDYLKHLEHQKDISIPQTAQFVLIGSTLLLIKSKSLLPALNLTAEEHDSIVDLEMRLKIFDRYKTISIGILEIFDVNRMYSREHVRRREPKFSPDKLTTIENLFTSINDVLKKMPKLKPEINKTVVQKVISLEDVMDKLSQRINSNMQVSFRQFSSDVPEGKVNMIVSFLAMLELVRQGVIRVEQFERFSDISMHADLVQTPKYN